MFDIFRKVYTLRSFRFCGTDFHRSIDLNEIICIRSHNYVYVLLSRVGFSGSLVWDSFGCDLLEKWPVNK